MALVKEHNTIEEAVQSADRLYSREKQGKVYVLAYDQKVTNKAADLSAAEKIGIEIIGFSNVLKNLFRDKSDALKVKLEEIGLSADEARIYEKKLIEGKILVISQTESAAI